MFNNKRYSYYRDKTELELLFTNLRLLAENIEIK